MQSALFRANIKPPVELVVANLSRYIKEDSVVTIKELEQELEQNIL